MQNNFSMDAMDYEFLLRRVYHCGRNGANGADADIYRKLERADFYLASTEGSETKEDREYDYRKAFAGVRSYVRQALRDGIKKVEYRATKEEAEKLEGMVAEVSGLHFYYKKRLDEIIDEADSIFRNHGLEPK